MTRWFRSVLVALTLGLLSPVAMAGILVGSFNALQLGWDNGKNLEKLAHIAHHLDLIAWQEVMTEEAVEALVHELETASGERWGYMVSHAIGRGSYGSAISSPGGKAASSTVAALWSTSMTVTGLLGSRSWPSSGAD
ncbi:hypothetical protein [Halomonas sp. PA16-9]|uniref:hypothetical protein n=1 Tax=Halomonas sp. PA16-9 TaxID=2576841 RepID=UPI0030EF848F